MPDGSRWNVPTQGTLELPASAAAPEGPAAPAPVEGGLIAGRYAVLGLLGAGGMGEVYRVRDHKLGRCVALKLIGAGRLVRAETLARFEAEARLAAGLEHPGVVPVYDLGETHDGRPFFTMREVQGQDLESILRIAHGPTGGGYTPRRLVELFRRAVEAVAYAHARGVVHRDLKPANIMVGAFGQVSVLDWGLALLRDAEEEEGAPTRAFAAGTPGYMPPEQAGGRPDAVDARADVYALGATLLHLLTGSPPFGSLGGPQILARLASGQGPQVGEHERLPDELRALCVAALSADPGQRPPHAGAFAEALGAWLEGAARREQALAMVEEADALAADEARLEAEARAHREAAAALLAGLPATANAEDRSAAWAIEDEALALDRRRAELGLAVEQRLEGALRLAPELAEAQDRLADRSRAAHARAEAAGDTGAARAHEARLRQHGAARYARYLSGQASFTLITDPPGARVTLYRYRERLRRLVLEPQPSPGETPVIDWPLTAGSYLVELRLPGRPTVRYPVALGREQRWDGAPPGEHAPRPVPLPAALGEHEIYVPAGPFWCGGDLEALPHPLPWRRLWAEGFVIDRAPVTNQEWLCFLDDLVASGREEEALAAAPRAPSTRPGERGRMMVGRRADGRFELIIDAEGMAWRPDAPVVHVSAADAAAYAAWRSARTGQPWRLPTELEWEKAARGVDGRIYPWGAHFDPDWSHSRDSRGARLGPAPVGSTPMDTSPYGVVDTAGNVQCWCADPFPAGTPVEGGRVIVGADPRTDEPRRVVRGGSFSHAAWFCRLDVRKFQLAHGVWGVLGVRLARSVPS